MNRSTTHPAIIKSIPANQSNLSSDQWGSLHVATEETTNSIEKVRRQAVIMSAQGMRLESDSHAQVDRKKTLKKRGRKRHLKLLE